MYGHRGVVRREMYGHRGVVRRRGMPNARGVSRRRAITGRPKRAGPNRVDPFSDVENVLNILFHSSLVDDTTDSSTTAWSMKYARIATLKDADVNSVDERGRTPLHLAAELDQDSLDVVKCLLGRGAAVDAKDADHKTPVFYAVRHNNWDACEELLLAGAHIGKYISQEKHVQGVLKEALRKGFVRNTGYIKMKFEINWPVFNTYKDESILRGNTILHLAILCGNEEYVRMLLENRASLEVRNNLRQTPFYLTVTQLSGSIQISLMNLLISYKACVNTSDHEGKSPLHRAIETESEEVVSYLLDKGSDVGRRDCNGMTPLHSAAMLESDAMSRLLLAKGADVKARNCKGETPLHCAISSGNIKNVQVLVKNGSELDAVDGRSNTPLLLAAARKDPEILKFLAEKEVNVNFRDEYGRTALHLRVMKDDLESVRCLLQKRADVCIKDAKQSMPIHYAVKYASSALVRALTHAMADISGIDWKYLREVAIERNDFDIVNLFSVFLNEAKSRPGKKEQIVDNQGTNNVCNNLLLALSNSDDNIVELLIKEGEDVVSEITKGYTPLMHVVSLGRESIVPLMLAKGANLKDIAELDKDRTVLHKAATGKREHALENLKRWICPVTDNTVTLDKDGNTALHIACLKGRKSLIRHLANYGNKECLLIKNKANCRAADLARISGRPAVEKYLNGILV